MKVLDLGTGSGAIAIALAYERPTWDITAVDISQAALSVAENNAQCIVSPNHINFIQSDWFSNLSRQCYHAIVANPPYIEAHDPHLSQGDLRFEPQHALVSGDDGLDALRHVIKASYDYLLPDGLLLVEHGYNQAQQVLDLFDKAGYQQCVCWADDENHDRISGGWRRDAL